MPQDMTTDQDPDDNDAEFVEVDPSGRYGRYKEVLGKGAFKKVYRAFDELEGIEVAWNQVKVLDLLRNSEDLERLYSEVHLLKTLKHKNIIKFYSSWVDTKNENINFITEIFTSGTLRQYRKKHKHVDLRALKKWSKQILEGLFYLHSHDPPVIHRDLKCDNIFVNGNQGEVKIGDLGLAAILLHAHSAHSVIGTPEFMAPELYEEEYNELVDIYAFGMCLLELVTFEYPYSECANAAQIYKKVTSGIKPAALEKVKDARVKIFIEKCIANVSSRLSAKELLMDPFLLQDEDSESIRSSRGEVKVVGDKPQPIDVDHGGKDLSAETSVDFTVQGQRKDHNTIFLKLKIEDSAGHVRNIHFPFDIEVDTAIAVASEMVEELDLTDQDVSAIAAMIDTEIQSHIPDWAPGDTSLDHSDEELTNPASTLPETEDEGNLVLERTPSGRRYWSDSPKVGDEQSPSLPGPSHLCCEDVSLHTENDFIADSGSAVHCIDGKGLGTGNEHIHGSKDIGEVKETNGLGESHYEESNATDGQDSRNVVRLLKNSQIESEDLTAIMEKLDNLLKQQQEELKELKMKHNTAIWDLLDGLSPENCQKVLDLCKHKVPQHGE